MFFSFTDASAYTDDFEEAIKFFTKLNGCFDIFQPYLKDKDPANKIFKDHNKLIILRAQVNLTKAAFSDLVDRLESCTVIKEDLDYLIDKFEGIDINSMLSGNSGLGGFTELCLKLE